MKMNGFGDLSIASFWFLKATIFPKLWKLQAVPPGGHSENCRGAMPPHLSLS